MMATATNELIQTTPDDLREVHWSKYGDAAVGWSVLLRREAGYFTPAEHYEALVSKLVTAETTWLDVGSGHDLFPHNRKLARVLADRCARLVGLDPDPSIHDNVYVHERVQATIEEFQPSETFDLITLRMVAEHITNPREALAALARLARPGGRVVIFTVNKWSLTALAARVTPFGLHHPAKKLLWGSKEEDTFPVAYRMNTRRHLRGLFQQAGFCEIAFQTLADASLFWNFRIPHRLELACWRAGQTLGLPYPETCLLGVYQRS